MPADGSRGRTVTVKIKWADFRQATRSRSVQGRIDSAEALQAVALDLMRSLYPPRMGIRLVGVTLPNLESGAAAVIDPELALG